MIQMHSEKDRKPRLSLTKRQLETALGAELLSLCQTMTADGRLTEAEVTELRDWARAQSADDLPAIEHLGKVLEKIFADGVITDDEYLEIYRAVESILPPEARKEARTARLGVQAEARATNRVAKEQERDKRREEAARLQPLAKANFMVAGVRYEGRQEIIAHSVTEGQTVRLERDPRNRFSRNAIKVLVGDGQQIGFVPEEDARDLAPVLDQGVQQEAWITKILGYNAMIPVVQTYLYRTDVSLDEVRHRPFSISIDLSTDSASARSAPLPNAPVRRANDAIAWILGGLIALLLALWAFSGP